MPAENLLRFETSPYLQQHADNPVHWAPWGAEVLEEARVHNKPILLSIGYAACHWCHVMAHESFEDDETAALMNQHFVCVKVDREERPDIDDLYMTALSLMGEQGGWPLTMFLDAQGQPFWGEPISQNRPAMAAQALPKCSKLFPKPISRATPKSPQTPKPSCRHCRSDRRPRPRRTAFPRNSPTSRCEVWPDISIATMVALVALRNFRNRFYFTFYSNKR